MNPAVDVSEIRHLAPMPASVARLVQLAFDPAAGVAEVAGVVQYDPALTANLLRWANSAWSGAENPVTSVRDAVVRLGLNQLLKLAVGNTVSQPMKRDLAAYALPENELWRHSLAAALAAENLPAFATQPVPAATFTAALIHDIGKLLLVRLLSPAAVAEIFRRIEQDQLTYVAAEREVLGVDHAAVGGEIARVWSFPESLVFVISHHHDPEPLPDPLLDAVQIANAVAKFVGVGLGLEQMHIRISPKVMQRVGLTYGRMEALCAAVKDRLATAEKEWSA